MNRSAADVSAYSFIEKAVGGFTVLFGSFYFGRKTYERCYMKRITAPKLPSDGKPIRIYYIKTKGELI